MELRPLLVFGLLVSFSTVAWAQAGVPPLTPAMECSACEVTAREIFKQYKAKSEHDKYAGTEVEIADVLDEACKKVSETYAIAQEAFGAHLKVFADSKSSYDMQNVQPPDFFSIKDEQRYGGATVRLGNRCYELIGIYEDYIVDHIKKKATEEELRKYMCIEQRDVCSAKVLKPYSEKEAKKRKKWKRRTESKKKAREKLQAELAEAEKEEEIEMRKAQRKEELRKKKLKNDYVEMPEENAMQEL